MIDKRECIDQVKKYRITAAQAICYECRDCCGSVQYKQKCTSSECALNDAREFKSSVKRIKAHCLDCCPEKTIYGVKACDGKLIGGRTGEPHMCPLHPFREGRNPFRPVRTKKEPTPAQLVARERFRTRSQSAKKPSNFASNVKEGATVGAGRNNDEK